MIGPLRRYLPSPTTMPSGRLRRMPDWSGLPLHLLVLIYEHLSTFVDFIRFRSVCSSWRSAASSQTLPPSLPFLAVPPVDSGDSNPTCYFLSVFEAKFMKKCLPSSCRDKRFIGSANGWLVMCGKIPFTSDASLFNPFTGAEIHLPPLRPDHLGRTGLFLKIVVSTPVAAGQISAVAILVPSKQIALMRPGTDEWTLFGCSPEFEDALFYGGSILVLDRLKRVFACEVDESLGPQLVELMPNVLLRRFSFLWLDRCYLVDSGGELTMVARLFDVTNAFKTIGFEVFKVDPNHQNQWMQISSLGDRSLFVGLNRSISIRASEHPGCIENCIYFADDAFSHLGWLSDHKFFWGQFADHHFDMGVFNLGNSCIDFFPNYLGKEERYSGPPALWFSPSPA